MKANRFRRLRNVHKSAEAACQKWLKGCLHGNPIHLDPHHIMVYGHHKSRWHCVFVEFKDDVITVSHPRATSMTLGETA